MNERDIVTRLGGWDLYTDESANDLDIADLLRIDWMGMTSMDIEERHKAADEIKRLRAEVAQRTEERDEARREVCKLITQKNPKPRWRMRTQREYAADRGWDCFDKKEVQP